VVLTILKNDGVRQWEGHPIYEMENNPNVPNHQPVHKGMDSWWINGG